MYTSMSVAGEFLENLGLALLFAGLSICLSLLIYQQLFLLKSIIISKEVAFDIFKSNKMTIIIKPIIEEFIFRYGIYKFVFSPDCTLNNKVILYYVISAMLFSIAHIPKDYRCFVEKLCVGGVFYSAIYFYYRDIMVLIFIHICHNFVILLLNRTREVPQ